MSKDLIVAILVPVIDQNGRKIDSIGTGCVVGEDQILTARHVVCPSQPREMKRKVRVCWYHQEGGCAPAEKAVEVEDDSIWWCGKEGDGAGQDNGPDVALIDCPRHEASRHIRSPRLAPDWPAVGRWSSRGFPRVAFSQTREHFDFDGTIKDYASTDTELTLHGTEGTLAKTAKQAASDWAGASGMPVFCGGQIVGVITEVIADVDPPQYLAVPTALVLAREDFRARYRRAKAEDLIDVGRKLVVELLEQDDTVLAALAKRLLPNSSARIPGSEHIAKQVLTMPIETLIDRALMAQHDLQCTRQYRAADLIAQLVQVALPASCDLFDIQEAHEITATAACCLIPARSSSVTLAEVIMAGADRRGARFWPQLDLDAWPRGLGCIGHLPEGGRDRTGAQAVRDLTDDLGEIFESRFDDDLEPSFRDYLKRRFAGRWRKPPADLPPEQAEQYEQELNVWIRREITRHASYDARRFAPYSRGYSYYLVAETPRGMDDEARAARDAILLRIKQTFPEIVVLTLAPEPFDSWKELEPYSKLRDLLYSANQGPR